MCMCVCVCVCACVCVCSVCVCMLVSLCTCLHLHVYMHICIHGITWSQGITVLIFLIVYTTTSRPNTSGYLATVRTSIDMATDICCITMATIFNK